VRQEEKPFGILVLHKMVFSWFSAPMWTLNAALLWGVAVMAFPVDVAFAVWCAGFAALLTIAVLDMWWTYYLKKKSFAGKILRSIGL